MFWQCQKCQHVQSIFLGNKKQGPTRKPRLRFGNEYLYKVFCRCVKLSKVPTVKSATMCNLFFWEIKSRVQFVNLTVFWKWILFYKVYRQCIVSVSSMSNCKYVNISLLYVSREVCIKCECIDSVKSATMCNLFFWEIKSRVQFVTWLSFGNEYYL